MATQTQSPNVTSLATPAEEKLKSKSLLQKALWRIWHDRLTMVALTVLGIMTLMAVFAPFITSEVLQVDYLEINLENNYADLGSPGHLLGTDEMGRDHLARLLYGGRISLGIGFSAAIMSLSIGIIIGVITGYYGGIVDDIIIWFITTLNSIPQLFLLLIIAAMLSPSPGSLVLVLGALGWTGATRIVRGETFSLKNQEFVIAARAVGASDIRIMFVHIVPNIISLLVISLALGIGGLILTESALSFLGFGVKAPYPTWGNMLSGGLDMIRRAPHLLYSPGLLIFVTVLCLYIIGDGLRDAFDPKQAD
ncbi:MAG: ABC transporter permease [Aggregatilineales bacterium]